jgi:hypothetical protein
MIMRPGFPLLAAWLLGLTAGMSPALAETWLTNTEIETVLKGQTLEGVYETGRRFTERYLENGRVEYTEGSMTMEGHWSATEGTLCTIYDSDPTGGCFRVSRSARNCLEFYFVSRSEAAAPGPSDTKPDWTARGALGGRLEACPETSSV